MSTLAWIIISGVAMALIALTGSITLLLREATLQRILLPLVAFAAGTLLGGALLHMLPEALARTSDQTAVLLSLLAGFSTFFALEQFLHWHHGHDRTREEQPLTWLILIGDGLHNLLGGLAVGTAFVTDVRLGVTTWLIAAAHEVPQELGDFAVLVHGGWPKRRALFFNVLSALTFLGGSLIAWAASFTFDVLLLLPFAAGNFLYIAASHLIPEVKTDHGLRGNAINFAAMISGVLLLYALRILIGG